MRSVGGCGRCLCAVLSCGWFLSVELWCLTLSSVLVYRGRLLELRLGVLRAVLAGLVWCVML